MGLAAKRSTYAGVPVLHLSQELDAATTSELVAVLTAIEAETDSLIVDLGSVTYVSSAPLGVLIEASLKMRAKHGVLVLASPQPDIRRVFSIAGLDDLIIVFQSLEEAADYVVLVEGRLRSEDLLGRQRSHAGEADEQTRTP